jgi:hypothetical protein
MTPTADFTANPVRLTDMDVSEFIGSATNPLENPCRRLLSKTFVRELLSKQPLFQAADNRHHLSLRQKFSTRVFDKSLRQEFSDKAPSH